jgi:hypothetical protein
MVPFETDCGVDGICYGLSKMYYCTRDMDENPKPRCQDFRPDTIVGLITARSKLLTA